MSKDRPLLPFTPKGFVTFVQAIDIIACGIRGDGLFSLHECENLVATSQNSEGAENEEFRDAAIRVLREELYERSLLAIGYDDFYELMPFEPSYFAKDSNVEELLTPTQLPDGDIDSRSMAFIRRDHLVQRLPEMLAEHKRSIFILDGSVVSPHMMLMVRTSAALDVRAENRVPKDAVERTFKGMCVEEGLSVSSKVTGCAAQLIRWPHHAAGGNFPAPEGDD
tara:strand:- start:42688 stop:43356 length:669 start_codon:yes stop_codon:yes gene_type:complete